MPRGPALGAHVKHIPDAWLPLGVHQLQPSLFGGGVNDTAPLPPSGLSSPDIFWQLRAIHKISSLSLAQDTQTSSFPDPVTQTIHTRCLGYAVIPGTDVLHIGCVLWG